MDIEGSIFVEKGECNSEEFIIMFIEWLEINSMSFLGTIEDIND